MVRLDVTSSLSGITTTEAVVQAIPQLSSYNLKRMLRAGDIRLNGARVKKDFDTAEGDIIEVYMPDELRAKPKLDIVYEDRNILVTNKKPGMRIRSQAGEPKEDLLSEVRSYMQKDGEYVEAIGSIPFAVDEFDINTGGLTLFAKNADTFDYLKQAARQRRIRRIFQAIVYGQPERDYGEFRHFYQKDDRHERIMVNRAQGAYPMFTRYRVLRSGGDYSLLEIEPVTGFMNQERMHLMAAGYPIVGDPEYGDARLNRKSGLRYQALWSTKISFSTGRSNILGYLNGRSIETDDILFPLVNLASSEDE